MVSGVSRRVRTPLMYSSTRDQLSSGLIEDVTWYSRKAGSDCPETGFRIEMLALFFGKLQASNPAKTSKKTRISTMMVLFFITTFQTIIKPVIKTKKSAMEFPTQVNR